MTGAVLVLSASPRPGGNCDRAARIALHSLRQQGIKAETVALRDHVVLPCIACGFCSRHPGSPCPQQAKDSSGPLLDALVAAPGLVLAAPIYFYHLPSQLKALIDRAQPLWAAKEAGLAPPPGGREAGVILVAARNQGKRLFEGSLLTLRFWLDLLGMDMASPLTLYGLDQPNDLNSDPEKSAAVGAYARKLGEQAWGGTDSLPPAP